MQRERKLAKSSVTEVLTSRAPKSSTIWQHSSSDSPSGGEDTITISSKNLDAHSMNQEVRESSL